MLTEVQRLLNTIQAASLRLEDIRAACPHEAWFVDRWMWRPGSIQIRRICSDCNVAFADPSKEELVEYDAKRRGCYSSKECQ